jgi:hypothetical protein
VSGGFFIVDHSDNKSPVGDFKIMAVLGYDPETKMYTYNAFDSWGELITAKGNVSDDTWTWIAYPRASQSAGLVRAGYGRPGALP